MTTTLSDDVVATSPSHLPSELVARVLAELGHDGPPPATLDGLTDLYGAWCRAIPFDNVRRVLQIAEGSRGPLAGWPASSFFTDWLEDGTGGVCVPTAWAWHSLLSACGFDSSCAVAALNGTQPNHLTVVVEVEGTAYVVDTAYQSEVPVPLRVGERNAHGAGLHEVRVRPLGDSWQLTYRTPAHQDEEPCVLLHRSASAGLARYLYRVTQAAVEYRRFNATLFCRRNTASGHLVVVGSRVTRAVHGAGISHSWDEDLAEVLTAELGYSPGIVRRLSSTKACA